MVTKKELEQKLEEVKETNNTLLNNLDELKADFLVIEKEYIKLKHFMGMLGNTFQQIYQNYSFVLKECCTDREILRLLEVQKELKNFIDKFKEDRDDDLFLK